MDLSVIIPAYNEGMKISKDIFAADKFIVDNNIIGEIIIVDDGSTDNTFNIANSHIGKIHTTLTVLKLSANMGKGGAVREGMNNSSGKFTMYADAGLTVAYENALVGINLIKEGKCDIANGSRKMENAKIIKEQDFDRQVISKVFGSLVKFFLKVPKEMTDTQCGFKVYKGDVARSLFKQIITVGFLFEIEFILLAIKEGYKILEFPVTWKCDRDSRLSVSQSSMKIISDFIFLFRKS